MVNVKVNGIAVSVPEGSTILEAARAAGVEIPTLCYMKEKNEIGACRICIVEATGTRGMVTACVYPVSEGMEIQTNSEKVRKARKTTLELILSTHEKKCLSCPRSTDCELQKLCLEYGVDEDAFEGFKPEYEKDYSVPHLVRDNNKCILCRRCVAACNEQFVGVIGANARGIDTNIGSPFDRLLRDVPCISCGQCTVVCPTGALTVRDDTDKVMAAIADPNKYVVVQTAPSVRAQLGESFGLPIGTNVEGKMVAALRRLGFDKVFDTDFGADLTIVEEANELVQRIQNGGVLPMVTSCSPGWVKFCEYYYPDLLPHLSTCKSPQQMQGAVTKTYFAEKMGIDPKDIVSVSVMPCTAKKFEIGRDDQSAAGPGIPDLDISIKAVCPCEVIEKGGTTIPVKLLFNAISKVAEGEVEFETDTKDRATICAGNTKFKVAGLPESEFPKLPQDEEAFVYTIQQATFRDMLRKVSYAASQDDTRRTLKGVLLSFKDSKLTMVATDGRRLALVEQEIEFPKDAEKDIILPSKAVGELQRSLNGEGDLSMMVQKNLMKY